MLSCFEDLIIRKIMMQSEFNLNNWLNPCCFFSFKFACTWMTSLLLNSSIVGLIPAHLVYSWGDGFRTYHFKWYIATFSFGPKQLDPGLMPSGTNVQDQRPFLYKWKDLTLNTYEILLWVVLLLSAIWHIITNPRSHTLTRLGLEVMNHSVVVITSFWSISKCTPLIPFYSSNNIIF